MDWKESPFLKLSLEINLFSSFVKARTLDSSIVIRSLRSTEQKKGAQEIT